MINRQEIGKKIWKKTKQKQILLLVNKRKLREEEYNKNPNYCKCCGKKIEIIDKLPIAKIKKRITCSKKCSALLMHKKKGTLLFYKPCLNCGTKIKGRKIYCSNICQQEYHYKKYIRDWKNGLNTGSDLSGASEYVKKYIREKYNNKCVKCGWDKTNPVTKKVPVQIEHINGNAEDNQEDNLILLCPNCHSLTPTFGSLNRGKGRTTRRLQYQRNKEKNGFGSC